MTTAEIRRAFLDYFAEQDHEVVPSAPLVPQDDPTLLFVNAGMVPFKDVFTGVTRRDRPRAASSQRCLRVSGKHNDLEEVGRTPRHHTLFEMLGNFSFGNYFKEEAVTFAWEFLTQRLKLDPSRMAVTVFGGEDGVPADEEAADLWRKVSGLPEDRIQRFGAGDNFWAMGDTGPCGPCSEIHYDLGDSLTGTVNDGDRWMEIWNLVFMQYVRDASGELRPLPAPSIDTGMGLERIASVVQGKTSNYQGDAFASLLSLISETVGKPYDGGAGDDAVSMRVIADHARATAFLLADGVHPDKTGRGYVLRKILRRAVSHGVLLGVDRPFLSGITDGVVEGMAEAHPVLKEQADAVRRGVEAEETLFRRTVEQGMRRIDDLLEQLENPEIWTERDGDRVLQGDVAFRLYDTYGCPLELTASVGVRRGFEVDEPGFYAAMEVQKERSRASWKGGSDQGALEEWTLKERGSLGTTRFTGYGATEGRSRVTGLALLREDGPVPADRAGEGASVALVTEATPFYAESGGQIGDTGEILADGARIRVEDTRKAAGGDVLVHFGTVEDGEVAKGADVEQRVDASRRELITGHHSSTHLVHHALREILGPHVQQKGSWVGPDHLRFDFSHPEAVTPRELAAIEARVNELVRANHEITADVLPYDRAIEAGALAFFGDKYGDEVRMVTMGPSRELCGGTHAPATGSLGLFTFLGEGSVASGVRRIEATSGAPALDGVQALRSRLHSLADRLKTSPDDVASKLEDLQEEARRLKRKLEEMEKAAAGNAAEDLARTARDVAGHKLIVGRAPVESRDALRDLGDALRGAPGTVVVLGTEMEGKVALVAAVSDDIVKGGRVKAGDLVGRVAKIAGGGGGGKPHLATAGAKDVAKLDEALGAAEGILSELVG